MTRRAEFSHREMARRSGGFQPPMAVKVRRQGCAARPSDVEKEWSHEPRHRNVALLGENNSKPTGCGSLKTDTETMFPGTGPMFGRTGAMFDRPEAMFGRTVLNTERTGPMFECSWTMFDRTGPMFGDPGTIRQGNGAMFEGSILKIERNGAMFDCPGLMFEVTAHGELRRCRCRVRLR